MVQRMKWFERKFAFDLPVWMYSNIVERLRGTPSRAEEMVLKLQRPLLTRCDGEPWSIQENVAHLLDLEPLWRGRLDDFLKGKPRLRDADLTNRETHEADHNAAPIEDILRSFREVRSAFVDQLDHLEDSLIERTAMHPRLEQPMRLLDMCFFVAEHDDHHLAQITKLIESFEKE